VAVNAESVPGSGGGDSNAVYRTYFKGPLPARAFIGAGSLLGGAHFDAMGMAVKQTAAKSGSE
jgi:hypothetical protein